MGSGARSLARDAWTQMLAMDFGRADAWRTRGGVRRCGSRLRLPNRVACDLAVHTYAEKCVCSACSVRRAHALVCVPHAVLDNVNPLDSVGMRGVT